MSGGDTALSWHLFVLATFNLGYGLCSLFIKERLFLSEALVALLFGAAVGPQGAGILGPDPHRDARLIYHGARLVLAVQVMAAGIQLPARYLRRHWRALALLLGPGMLASWLTTAALVRLLFRARVSLQEALLVGAILSPTDPVLANSIVKGRFAETHVPLQLRTLLSAESGANDGSALPCVILASLLLARRPGLARAMLLDVLLRKLALAILLGLAIGFLARKALRRAEACQLIDKESLVAFHLALALATTGLCMLVGTSDLLALFVVGVAFSWDGWFEEKTAGTDFQAIIDGLCSQTFFVLVGAAVPWAAFQSLGYARLVVLALLVLLLRRIPATLLLSPLIGPLKNAREALFVGWFGPMGVAALFYASEAILQGDSGDVAYIVWFLVLASVIVHGVTVPMFHRTTVSQTFTLLPDNEAEALEVLTILITDDAGSSSLASLSSASLLYSETQPLE